MTGTGQSDSNPYGIRKNTRESPDGTRHCGDSLDGRFSGNETVEHIRRRLSVRTCGVACFPIAKIRSHGAPPTSAGIR